MSYINVDAWLLHDFLSSDLLFSSCASYLTSFLSACPNLALDVLLRDVDDDDCFCAMVLDRPAALLEEPQVLGAFELGHFWGKPQ